MKTHILLLQEREKLQKLIGSLTKADQIMLLYTAEDDTVSIKDFQLFANAKCKIQFIEAPNVNGVPEIGLAYVYGKLKGQYSDAILDSEEYLFKQLKDGDSPAKPKRARGSATKAEKKEFPMPKPVELSEDIPATEPKPKTRRKAKTQDLPDNADFDHAFGEMEHMLETLKKDGFNPKSHIGSICKAVALMDSEKIGFEEAIGVCSSRGTADKISNALRNSQKEIIDLARKVNKYDKQ